jgi:hypothetical protein
MNGAVNVLDHALKNANEQLLFLENLEDWPEKPSVVASMPFIFHHTVPPMVALSNPVVKAAPQTRFDPHIPRVCRP